MHLLGIALQNKNGENIILATGPSMWTRNIVLYCNLIFEGILEAYRNYFQIQEAD